MAGRAPSPGAGKESSSARTDGKRLTLRGTLHYLYEQAELNRWVPGMAGKRNWYVIRKHLLLAAEGKLSKGRPLRDTLYIPEPVNDRYKDEIARRRMAKLAKATAPDKGPRQLMLLIAEIKNIFPGRFGHRLMAEQLDDFPFLMDDVLHGRFIKRFESQWGLFKAIDTSHLIAIGTFGVASNGVAALEEISVMLVNENWIPLESMYEKDLIDKLTAQKRTSFEALTLQPSLQHSVGIHGAPETAKAVAMYVIPPSVADTEEYKKGLEESIQEEFVGCMDSEARPG